MSVRIWIGGAEHCGVETRVAAAQCRDQSADCRFVGNIDRAQVDAPAARGIETLQQRVVTAVDGDDAAPSRAQ